MTTSFITSLLPLMCDTVLLQSRLGTSRAGEPVFGSPISAKAHISFAPYRYINANGTLVSASGKAWVAAYVDDFDGEGQFTLPDGSTPTIAKVALMRDEAGESHMEILFG